MDLKPGSKCFAKVKGYSPWPARIDVLPADVKIPRGKYPVFFYGTHEVSYVTAKDIFDFEKYQPIYGLFKEKNPKFNNGIKEMENNPTIFQLGFDKKAVSFLAQFYKFDSQKLNGEISPIQIVMKVEDQPAVTKISDRKRQHSCSENNENEEVKCKILKIDDKLNQETNDLQPSITNETISEVVKNEDELITEENESKSSTEAPENIIKKENMEVSIILEDVLTCTEIPSVRRLPESSDVNIKENKTNDNALNHSSNSPTSKEENLNVVLNDFKSPIKIVCSERPKRASAIKFSQNFQSYLKTLNTNQKHTSKKTDPQLRIKRDSDRLKKTERKIAILDEKNRIKNEANTKKCLIEDHNVPVNHDRNSECRISRIIPASHKDESHLRIVSKLSIIDKEIKRSLVVGQENHEKCRKMMQSMLELNNLTLVLLCRVPEIIVTIRKCRRYKKDDSIKSSASRIFQNFYQIYDQAELDEKSEAGAELLKRNANSCKSAQMLLDELFVVDKSHNMKSKVSSIVISSPSSAHSIHSSANNTPLPNNDVSADATELDFTLDLDSVDINELIKQGVLECTETYSCEDSKPSRKKNQNMLNEKRPIIDDVELYKQLGV